MAYDVFISYSIKDKFVADGICVNLEAAGIRCWIAPRDIAPGEDWPTAVARAISQSHVMVLVFSASSNSSEDVSRELFLAANNKLVIIPFKIENIEPEPGKQYFLARTHWLDAINPPTKEQIHDLLICVKALIPVRVTPPVIEVQPTIPPHIDQPISGNEPPQAPLPEQAPPVFKVQPTIPPHIDQPISGNKPPKPSLPKQAAPKKSIWLRYLWIPALLVLVCLIGVVVLALASHGIPALARPTATTTAVASETRMAPSLVLPNFTPTSNFTATKMVENYFATQTRLAQSVPATANATSRPAAQAVVNIESVNVRSGPGTEYPVLGFVVKDNTLSILGQAYNCSWLEVTTPDGKTGWVSTTYVTYNLACSEIAQAPIPPVPTQAQAQATSGAGGQSPSCDNSATITITNNTGLTLTISLVGPANYSFNLGPGDNTLNVCPGTYSYSMYGCAGGSLTGTISSGEWWTFSCQ